MFAYHQATPHFQQQHHHHHHHHPQWHPSSPAMYNHRHAPSPLPTTSASQHHHDYHPSSSPAAFLLGLGNPQDSRSRRTPHDSESHSHSPMIMPSCGVQALRPSAPPSAPGQLTTSRKSAADDIDMDMQIAALVHASENPNLTHQQRFQIYKVYDTLRRHREVEALQAAQARRSAEGEAHLIAQARAEAEAQAKAKAIAVEMEEQRQARAAAARVQARIEAEAELARRALRLAAMQKQRAEAEARIRAQAEREAAIAAAAAVRARSFPEVEVKRYQQQDAKRAFFAHLMEQIHEQQKQEQARQNEHERQVAAQLKAREEEARKKEEGQRRQLEEMQQKQRIRAAQQATEAAKKAREQPTSPAEKDERNSGVRDIESAFNTPEDFVKYLLAQFGLAQDAQPTKPNQANAETQAQATSAQPVPKVDAKGKGKERAQADTPAASAVPSNNQGDSTTVSRGLSVLEDIRNQFRALRDSFNEPERLVFDDTVKPSTSASASDSDAGSDFPALTYTSVNRPIKNYEESLTRLLTEIDNVQSNGLQPIKDARKDIAVDVQAELDRIDAIKLKHWNAQMAESQNAIHVSNSDARGTSESETSKDGSSVTGSVEPAKAASHSTETASQIHAVPSVEDSINATTTTETATEPSTTNDAQTVDSHDAPETATPAPVDIYQETESPASKLDLNDSQHGSIAEGSAGDIEVSKTAASTDAESPPPGKNEQPAADTVEVAVSADASSSGQIDIAVEVVSGEGLATIDAEHQEPEESAALEDKTTKSSEVPVEVAVETARAEDEAEVHAADADDERQSSYEIEAVSDSSEAGDDQIMGNTKGKVTVEEVEEPAVPSNTTNEGQQKLKEKATTVSDEDDDDDAEVQSETSFEWIE